MILMAHIHGLTAMYVRSSTRQEPRFARLRSESPACGRVCEAQPGHLNVRAVFIAAATFKGRPPCASSPHKTMFCGDPMRLSPCCLLPDEPRKTLLRMRMEGFTQQQIADKLGFKTTGAISKRIAKIAAGYEAFAHGQYNDFLSEH